MTVRELLNVLEVLDPDEEVYIVDENGYTSYTYEVYDASEKALNLFHGGTVIAECCLTMSRQVGMATDDVPEELLLAREISDSDGYYDKGDALRFCELADLDEDEVEELIEAFDNDDDGTIERILTYAAELLDVELDL